VASRSALPRLHAGALAPSQWHTHSPRSRGLPHTRMPSHAHTSPALNSCPSVFRQHTGPGPCQCLLRGRCRHQQRRTVKRDLLRGRVPAVLRVHHRVFAHLHKRVPKSQVVMQGWVREMPQGQQASRQAVLLVGSGSRSSSPCSGSESSDDSTPASPRPQSVNDAEDNVEQCSSPRLDWMPFTPPPTAAKPAPTVKTGSQSSRNRVADAVLVHNQLVEGCKTPEEFVGKVKNDHHVYGAIPGMFRQWVDQSPTHDTLSRPSGRSLFERCGQ
jgi:hypothetical protein